MSIPRHPEFYRTFSNPKNERTVVGIILAGLLGLIVAALALGVITLMPTFLIMLALGVLHHDAVSAIPALGFGSTFLVVYGVSAVVMILRQKPTGISLTSSKK